MKSKRTILGRLVGGVVLASAMVALAFPAAAMTFEAAPASGACGGRACILATGLIDKDTVGQFAAFLGKNRPAPGATVALNSEGGVLLYGLQLGEQIRRAGLSTIVPGSDSALGAAPAGECASACVFSFLGGVERSLGKGARVGVHQIYSNPQARDAISVSDAQWLTSLAAQHIDRMGGAVGILVMMLRTPPEGIRWFSPAELGSLGVVTTARYVVALAN